MLVTLFLVVIMIFSTVFAKYMEGVPGTITSAFWEAESSGGPLGDSQETGLFTVGPGVVFQMENQNYTVNQSTNFTAINISDDYISFNDTRFYVTSPGSINLTVFYVPTNVSEAGEGDKVLEFSANTTGGNVQFDFYPFPYTTNYTVNRSGNTIAMSMANSSGYISFNNSIWSEQNFEVFQSGSGTTTTTTSTTTTTVENIPPVYSGEALLQPSGSDYSYYQAYQFNLTWTDSSGVDKVWIEENLTGALGNHTVSSFEGSEYYYDILSLGAGNYSYRWFANDTAGNVNDSFPQADYIINRSVPLMTVSGSNITYPAPVSVTASEGNNGDSDLNYTFWRDDNLVSSAFGIDPSPDAGQLAAGLYAYLLNTSGGDNWTSVSEGDSLCISVGKGPTETSMHLDGMAGNRNYVLDDEANFTVVLNVTGKGVYLQSNMTGWVLQSGATPLMNYTNLSSTGYFNMTGYFPGSENYTASLKTYYANVTLTDETAPPVFVDSPDNTTYSSTMDLNVTAYEPADWCGWNLNDTENSTMMNYSKNKWYDAIDCPQGTHRLHVYCNDSSGNMGSNTSVYFTYKLITTTTTSTTSTTLGAGGSGGGISTEEYLNFSDDIMEIKNIYINPGSSKAFNIGEWNGKVGTLVVYADQRIYAGKVIMERLDPWDVWEVPTLENLAVYRYMRIETENIENRTSGLTIYFSVTREWMDKNSAEDPGLWRYGRKWERLPVERVSENSSLVNFKSNPPGFSYFAIAGERIEYAGSAPTTVPEILAEPSCGNDVCEPGETEISCPDDCETVKPERGLELVISISILVSIALGLVAWQSFRKKNIPIVFEPRVKTKIRQILDNPEKYLGKKVAVECYLEPYHYMENQRMTVYNIRDDTGRMLGISKKSNYEGEGIIKGLVTKTKGGYCIKF